MTTTLTLPDNALTITDTAPFTALTSSLRASLATLSERGAATMQHLRAEAIRLSLDTSIASQWIYTGISGHPDDEFDLEIALPITSAVTGTPGPSFAVRHVPTFHCAQYTYTGSWRNLGDVYDALFKQFYAAEHVYDGRVREIYRVVDMENPDNCVTDIQLGIAG